MGLDWKVALGILCQTTCRISGQLVLSYGMRLMPHSAGTDGSWFVPALQYAAASPIVLFGVLLLAGDFAIHLGLLTRVDVSIVVPSGSLTYLLTALLATWILHEQPPAQRWAGIVLITVGVALVLSSQETSTRPAAEAPALEAPGGNQGASARERRGVPGRVV